MADVHAAGREVVSDRYAYEQVDAQSSKQKRDKWR
jgi:hypothetical protein